MTNRKNDNPTTLSTSPTLRARAEQMLRTSRADVSRMSRDDIQKMVHELQVHQMELKLQNEELLAAQLDLANSRDRYSDLYDFAPVGYLTLDSHGVIQTANLTAASMLGLERHKLVNEKLSRFVARTSQDDYHRHLQAVFSDDQKSTGELTILATDPPDRVMQIESVVVKSRDLDSAQCHTALIDITRQKEATEWMIQAKRLRTMVENLPAGAVFVENDRIEINRTAEEITGYFRNELTTLDEWFLKLYGDKAVKNRELYEADRAAGFPEPELSPFIRKDGEERIAEIVGHGFDHHDIWLLRDVTERFQIAEALRAEHQLSESLINTAQGIVLLLDMQGKIVRFNPYFESLTGWRLEDIQGCDWLETCIPKNERAAIRQRFGMASRGERTVGKINGVLCRDGSLRVIEWYDAILCDEEGIQIGLLATGQDITERRALQRHLLQIADEEKRRIGHDLHDGLGQELTGLTMMAESLTLDLQNKSLPESKIANRIATQIESSLEHVRALARGMNPVDIDPQGLASELNQLAQHASSLYRIDCKLSSNGNVRLHDSEMATNLYRIAQEAITNAAKHGAATAIEIRIAQINDRLEMRVSDNGTGIADVKRIQSGVGMRSMRYRADLIGGTIQIDSPPSGGTVVICSLPINTVSLRN